MRFVQLAQRRVGLGLSNFPDGGSDDVGLVVPMLGNCLFDGLNDPLRGALSWNIIFKIRSFRFLYSYFLFRKVFRGLSDAPLYTGQNRHAWLDHGKQ